MQSSANLVDSCVSRANEIKRGFYFTGPKVYYLPGTPQLDILGSLSTTLQLSKTPQQGLPVFVGNYIRDSQGFYEKNVEYRYKTAAAETSGTRSLPGRHI